MNRVNQSKSFVSVVAAMSMLTPIMAGCSNPSAAGGANSNVQAPAQTQSYGSVPAPRNVPQQPQQRQGMSTGKKVALLTGAVALYYLYNKHKNAQAQRGQATQNGQAGQAARQYYRSKNGRIYYRDAQGNAVYVTPPAQGIQVPADIADQYNRTYQSAQRNSNYEAFDNLPVGNDNYSLDNFATGGGAGYGSGTTGYGSSSQAAPGPRRY